MTLRRYTLLSIVIAALGLGLVLAYLARPYPVGPGVRWDNVGRIELGMTQPEVVTIIGTLPQSEVSGGSIEWAPPGTLIALMWSDRECDIWVYLDRDRRVIGREGFGGKRPAWHDRLRHRLGI